MRGALQPWRRDGAAGSGAELTRSTAPSCMGGSLSVRAEPHRLEALAFLLLPCRELLELLRPGRRARVPPGSSSATTQPRHRAAALVLGATSGSTRMGPRRLDAGRMKSGKTRLEKPRLSDPCLLRFRLIHTQVRTRTCPAPPHRRPQNHTTATELRRPGGLQSPGNVPSPAGGGENKSIAFSMAPTQGRRQAPGALGNAACGREPAVGGSFVSVCAGDTAQRFVLPLPAPCPGPKDPQDRAGEQHQRTKRCF